MRERSLRYGMDGKADDEGLRQHRTEAQPAENRSSSKTGPTPRDGPDDPPRQRTDLGSVADQSPADQPVERAGPRAVPGPAGAARPGTVLSPDHRLHPLQVLSTQTPVLRR